MPDADDRTIVPTSDQLRGLSHPIRIKLLGLLRMDGPQTSADLARVTGLNTGATSYHLRQLAQHGFVEDAPGIGTGRERHWRARHRGTETAAPVQHPGEGSSLDDQNAFRQTVVTWTTGVVQAANDEWAELPPQWREVSELNDSLMRLTAEQAAHVLSTLKATLRGFADEHRYDPEAVTTTSDVAGDGDDRELWEVHLLAFPVPGRLPHREEP